MKTNKVLLVIMGPTAVGKTEITLKIALKLNCAVLNADSRQIFRELNIGTAKPTMEDLKVVKHYFIGTKGLNEYFSAGMFEREGLEILEMIYRKANLAILSGGSGLYIDAICKGLNEMPGIDTDLRKKLKNEYDSQGLEMLDAELKEKDPEFWQKVDRKNPQRILRALEVIRATGVPYSSFRKGGIEKRPFRTIKIGLDRSRDILYDRINRRVDDMVAKGLFHEVEQLYEYRSNNALQTVGYQEVFGFLDGEYDQEEAIRLLKRNTRRYAKRQLTWFKRDAEVTWFDPDNYSEIERFLENAISG